MGKIDIDGITVVFGGQRTKGDSGVSDAECIRECGLSRLYTLFGVGEFSGSIRLLKPQRFVSMFPEDALAEESPGISRAELRQLVCFAESDDGDHFTAANLADSPEFFWHSAGFDLRRSTASSQGFFGMVEDYRSANFRGLPHYFESVTSDGASYDRHTPEIGRMTPEQVLEKLSQILQPERAFINEDAFIVTLDSIGAIAVLEKLQRPRPTKTWWLRITLEDRTQPAKVIEYCEQIGRLGFQE